MTNEIARQGADGALANSDDTSAAVEHWLGTGDLSKLSGAQRAALYTRTCESLGINSLTRPFDWIEFYDPETKGKKLVLYPRAACADQLAYQHRIRVEVVEEKIVGSLFKVAVVGTMPNGRTETNVAYLDLTDRDGGQLKGQRLGNAFMKCHTKAKRRLVFGMVGMMAPPDVEDLQQARVVYLDGRGDVLDNPTPEQMALAASPATARTIGEPIWEDVPSDDVLPDGSPDQRPRREDLEAPPRPPGPRPSFRASDEDVNRWLGAWFGAVKGTNLGTDDARHGYVKQWTRDVLGWPEAKRTDSLRTMFARMTDTEAGEFLAHVRLLCESERRSYLEDADEARSGARPRGVSQEVHDAVQLTGGPATDDQQADDGAEF